MELTTKVEIFTDNDTQQIKKEILRFFNRYIDVDIISISQSEAFDKLNNWNITITVVYKSEKKEKE